ncbi:MAG: hypothetical protein ACI832_003231, partial [Rheinheimera aquimaris]
SKGYARQERAKQRSLHAVNEHAEPVFNAAEPKRSQANFSVRELRRLFRSQP